MTMRETMTLLGAIVGLIALWLVGVWLGVPAMIESGHYTGPAKWLALASGGVSILYIAVAGPRHIAANVRRKRLIREYHARQRS